MKEQPNSSALPPMDREKETASQFRPRQRPSKARKRKKDDTPASESAIDSTSKGDAAPDADDDSHRPQSFLFKEAQLLRDKNRESSALLHTNQGSHAEKEAQDKHDSQHNVPGGRGDVPPSLHDNFSVERSGQALEKNLDQYIESGFRAKFGDKEGDKSQKDEAQQEDSAFEVPLNLQVDEKPAYDPGEGLPAAGVEEVDVPIAVPQQFEKEARHDARQNGAKRGHDYKRGLHPKSVFPTNLSADYTQHRKDWMEKHLPNRHDTPHDKATKEATQGEAARSQEHPKRESSRANRGPPASDAAFAEKFRKRWRQR